ncbi:MAG: hypothetical protein M0R46_04195 [Candidatus Muirbacterium halophilum]|nr:hypothetical protein [Candidatus Muirbacterium halophilum]MCK9475094.1 hypothetical protein [Candidatus Muirbacterium halophilum]
MKKINKFIDNIIIYKSVEGFLFTFILLLIIKNLCNFYNINSIYSYISFLYLLYFFYKNKCFFNKKSIINNIEKFIPHNYSIINLYLDKEKSKKYRFSSELIEAEKKRNSDYFKNYQFKVNYFNIIILISIALILSFGNSLSKEYKNVEKIPFLYQVSPKNTVVLFESEIEFGINSNKEEEFNINIIQNNVKNTFKLDKNKKFKYKIVDKIQYYFSSNSFVTDTYSVEVIYPLINTDISWNIKYPEYAGSIEKNFSGENLNIPEGSEAFGKFTFNNKIKQFKISENESNNDNIILYANSNQIRIINSKENNYKIEVEDIYGQFCFIDISVKNLVDNPPKITVIIPTELDFLIEKLLIPLKFTAEDDFGLISSRLEITYIDGSEFKQEISKYNSTSIIEEKTLAVKKNGKFQIFVSDKNTEIGSEIFTFNLIDDIYVLKQTYDSAEKAEQGIKDISDSLKEESARIAELSEKLISSGEIEQKDSLEAEKIMDNLNNAYERSSEVLKDLDKTEEFLKKHEAASQLFEKIEKLRNTIRELMSENIRNTMEELAKISQNQNMSFDSWKSFAESTDMEKLSKSLENSLNLFDKAKKDQQEAAMIELLEYLKDRTLKAVLMLENIKTIDFGILKGIKINIEQIKEDFLYVEDFYGKNDLISEISESFSDFAENVFKDKDKSIKIGKIIVEKIDKFLNDKKKSFENRKNEEKKELLSKLQNMFDITLSSLKIVNKVNYGYSSGKDIYEYSQDISLIKKNINKIVKIFEEITKDSFILDSTKIKEFYDVYIYIDNVWERGKEGSRIDSYLLFSEKKLFSLSLYILESYEKLKNMKDSTALSEMMDRIKEMQKKQQQLGQEIMDYMNGEKTLDDFMDYFAQMQSEIRKEVSKLMGSGMDNALGEIIGDMAELERKMIERDITDEELKNTQESLKQKFRKILINLEEKKDKDDYKAYKSEDEFDIKEGITNKGESLKKDSFFLPERFPEVSPFFEKIIKDYMNGL